MPSGLAWLLDAVTDEFDRRAEHYTGADMPASSVVAFVGDYKNRQVDVDVGHTLTEAMRDAKPSVVLLLHDIADYGSLAAVLSPDTGSLFFVVTTYDMEHKLVNIIRPEVEKRILGWKHAHV